MYWKDKYNYLILAIHWQLLPDDEYEMIDSWQLFAVLLHERFST